MKNSQKINFYIVCLLLSATVFWSSCSQILDPTDENLIGFDRVVGTPSRAEGLLLYGYTQLPSGSISPVDVATDDAVSNDKANSYLRMATGEWTASFNPVEQWTSCLAGIQAVNQFLAIVDNVPWRTSSPYINSLYVRRFKGEAYGLRALLKFHLLQTVAGEGANGVMLGIPLMDEFLTNDADFNIPRATFAASVNSIYSDIDRALRLLAPDYGDVADASGLPEGFSPEIIGTDSNGAPLLINYNIVFGEYGKQRISGRIIRALRVRLALTMASPVYNRDGDPQLWEQAAGYAGELLQSIGGVNGLDQNGHRFFLRSVINSVNLQNEQPEMIWRASKYTSNDREKEFFPPLHFGRARLNPTQNLVDAFPMQNGYPITDRANAGYDENNPYEGRDPRLNLYIMCDGSLYKGQQVRTGTGGKENARDSIATSTRTGYYLKKMLVEEVNLTPTASTVENHYDVYFRYTEIYLAYAEAANEAWGPDGKGTFGFSARDVVRAIRRRGGIRINDTYLTAISSKENMRDLIRNERRLELCFEGFRFWDLRRWGSDLNETARGVEITGSGDAVSYRYIDVENRRYQDFMNAGPVPFQELIKYDQLIQNKGW
jgi:hypothetical protein